MQYAYTTGTLGTVQQIVSYAYGDADWKDKLTRYNGVDIAYDAIGNPIHDGVWAYTWENGRQLRRMACDATIAEFMYNADGLRVQKTVNGVATNYTLHGTNIVHMTKGNAELHFWYDAQNRPAIVEFNGTKYGYLYNLQGDVIGLIDSANTEVVKYTYDAWGKPLSVTGSLANTIGYYNPFRYRGYVYDVETGLYYVSSRYYDPKISRFINADDIEYLGADGSVLSYNLLAYCMNDPVNRFDVDGNWSLPNWAKIVIGVVAIAVGVGVTAFTGGTVIPALVAGVEAACAAGAISAGTSAMTTAVCSALSGDSFSTVVQKFANAAVDGFADGFMAGGIVAGAAQVASGGFKIAANLGAETGKKGGIKLGNAKILSPDAVWHENNGGTLLKIGETFRIDVGSNTLLHMHLRNGSSHIQIGTIGAGIYGWLE